MGRKRGSGGGTKPEKKAPVKLDLIPRLKPDGKIHEAWKIMEDYVSKKSCFEHLRHAILRMYWTKDWKPDVDRVVTGAAVAVASERERLDAEGHKEAIPDAHIILPKMVWPTLSDLEKRIRVFHELCHVAWSKDAKGEVKRTTRDWPKVRLRKHPIVAFHEEVEEFGVEAIIGRNGRALEALEHADRPIIAAIEKAAAATMDGNGDPASASPANPSVWRLWPTSCLAEHGLPAGKLKLLEEAGLETMGKLMDRLSEPGDACFRIRDVKGFGEGGYDAMTEAIVRLRKARPEFQADEQQAAPSVPAADTTDTDSTAMDVNGDGDRETRALALSNQGIGMRKIAEELGVSERQVRKLLGRLP
jgi:hypothetical protein